MRDPADRIKPGGVIAVPEFLRSVCRVLEKRVSGVVGIMSSADWAQTAVILAGIGLAVTLTNYLPG